MEMEALVFAALTHKAGIRSAVVCVTLLDRLQGDQVTMFSLIETGCERTPGDDTKGGAYPVAGQAHGSSVQVLYDTIIACFHYRLFSFFSYIFFLEVLLTKFRFIQSELKSGEEAISAPEVTPCQRAKLCTKQSQSNFEDN